MLCAISEHGPSMVGPLLWQMLHKSDLLAFHGLAYKASHCRHHLFVIGTQQPPPSHKVGRLGSPSDSTPHFTMASMADFVLFLAPSTP